jgi:hypothetical protein
VVETYPVDTRYGRTLNDPDAQHGRMDRWRQISSNAGATLVFATNPNPQ